MFARRRLGLGIDVPVGRGQDTTLRTRKGMVVDASGGGAEPGRASLSSRSILGDGVVSGLGRATTPAAAPSKILQSRRSAAGVVSRRDLSCIVMFACRREYLDVLDKNSSPLAGCAVCRFETRLPVFYFRWLEMFRCAYAFVFLSVDAVQFAVSSDVKMKMCEK